MSKIKISEDQYIGKQELIRMRQFLDEDGFKKLFRRIVNTYGVVFDNEFPDGLKVVQGSRTNTINIKAGMLVDSNMQIGTSVTQVNDVLTIPNNGASNRIYARYAVTNAEVGTISIDTSGNVFGVGTKFTEVLRGQPTNAVKIRFINSSNNILDYEVLDVISDTQCVVQAPSFVSESNLKYGVVGSFSPGVVIDPARKMIYNHDSIEFTQSTDVLAGWYLLAEVSTIGGILSIIDRRISNRFTLILQPSIEQDGSFALLGAVQTFKKTNTFQQGSEAFLASQRIALPDDGNNFIVGINDTQLLFIEDRPIGTELKLTFMNVQGSNVSVADQAGSPPNGYKAIKLVKIPTESTMTINPFDTITIKRVNAKHTQSPASSFDGWLVTNHSGEYGLIMESFANITTLTQRIADFETSTNQSLGLMEEDLGGRILQVEQALENVASAATLAQINQTLSTLSTSITTLSAIAQPFLDKGSMLFWNKPANEIPAGWQESQNWRGRMPIGFDPNQTEFDRLGEIGGSKKVYLIKENIPRHDHPYVAPSDPGDHPGGGNGYDRPNGTKNATTGPAGGDPDLGGAVRGVDIMNPYRVVMFIEWVGINVTPTPIAPPTVISNNVTNITRNGGKITGSVVDTNGSPLTEKGMVWSKTPNPVVGVNSKMSQGLTGSGVQTIEGDFMSFLTPNTIYYVRLFAINAAGVGYATEVSFKTLP